nr:nucleotide pyrophosphatase/phosphodiesterase family protein [Gordonia araii]
MPSVAAALDDAGDNPLGIAPARDIVVLLIDGLGAELLNRHAEQAPTLAAGSRHTLRAGFPATTATSITSLAVGAPCATHGIIGYSFGMPADGGREILNALRWRTGSAEGPDARDLLPPESVQPVASTVQRLAQQGLDVHYVVPGYQVRSGLTRAAFRTSGTLHDAENLDDVRDGILDVATHSGTDRRFAYAYYPALDMNGHIFGSESAEWLAELARIDSMVADLMTDLPSTATLLITGDHGMVNAGTAVDLDQPDFRHDVELIAGEARARHVYADRPDAVADVAGRWTEALAGHARVVTKEQALDEHWFGPTPSTDTIRGRIGDIVAAAEGDSVLVCPTAEPIESMMVGHHGSWTDDEQLVPLISNR